VLDSVFAEGSDPAVADPTVREPEEIDWNRSNSGQHAGTDGAEADDGSDAVKERLRGLGYIDD